MLTPAFVAAVTSKRTRSIGWLGSAFACAIAVPAHAQVPRLEAGVRIAERVVRGSGGYSDKLMSALGSVLSLELELNYRLSPVVSIGGYLMYGQGSPGSRCDAQRSGVDSSRCSAHDARTGVALQFHARPSERFDPWFGVGTGYEWFGASSYTTNGMAFRDQTTSARGFEFLALQAGLDVKTVSWAAVGPFVSFSIARYSAWSEFLHIRGLVENMQIDSTSSEGPEVSGAPLHHWFVVGARGVLELF